MENKQYLAHIREDGAGQTVKEHLLQTAARAKAFAAAFQGEAVAEQAALAHDLGKYTAAFQRRLCENGPKVDHSTAGARALEGNKMRCAAFCAAGHHTGPPCAAA